MSAIWFPWLQPFRNDKQNHVNTPLHLKLGITAHRRQNKTLLNYMKIFTDQPPPAKMKILVNKNVT